MLYAHVDQPCVAGLLQPLVDAGATSARRPKPAEICRAPEARETVTGEQLLGAVGRLLERHLGPLVERASACRLRLSRLSHHATFWDPGDEVHTSRWPRWGPATRGSAIASLM